MFDLTVYRARIIESLAFYAEECAERAPRDESGELDRLASDDLIGCAFDALSAARSQGLKSAPEYAACERAIAQLQRELF